MQEGKCIGIIFLQKENYDFKSALYAPELWGENSIRDINNVWWVVAHAGVFYIFENSLKNFFLPLPPFGIIIFLVLSNEKIYYTIKDN